MKYLYKVVTLNDDSDNCLFESLELAHLRFEGYKQFIINELKDDYYEFRITHQIWDYNDYKNCFMKFQYRDATGKCEDILYIRREMVFETEEEYLKEIKKLELEKELKRKKI